MTDKYILNAEGVVQPCDDLITYAQWFEHGNRVLQQDQVGKYFVSTVFRGLDHNFFGDGPPILWETMIFGNGKYADSQWRYSSREAALEGHKAAVRLAGRTEFWHTVWSWFLRVWKDDGGKSNA